MPVDYSRGKIYKIISEQTEDVYIGSTCEPILARRLAKHRANYTAYLKGSNKYTTSFKIVKHADSEIFLIELYPCASKDELHKRERYWIEQTANKVNKFIPTRKPKEFYIDNKERIDKRHAKYAKEHPEVGKKYYDDNKEEILVNKKEYYTKNREKILEKKKEYQSKHPEIRKQYAAANKERIGQQQKKYQMTYREEHKDEIKRKNAEQVICECGSVLTKPKMLRHKKTMKHMQFEKEQNKNVS